MAQREGLVQFKIVRERSLVDNNKISYVYDCNEKLGHAKHAINMSETLPSCVAERMTQTHHVYHVKTPTQELTQGRKLNEGA